MTWLLFTQFVYLCLLVADTVRSALHHGQPTAVAQGLRDALVADADPSGEKVRLWKASLGTTLFVVGPLLGLVFFALLVQSGCDTRWSLLWGAFYAVQLAEHRWRYRSPDVALGATQNFWRTTAVNAVEGAVLWKAGLFWGLLP